MSLTPEQILQIRREHGIPDEGFGVQKTSQPAPVGPTPEERIARRRNLAAQQKAKQEAERPQGVLSRVSDTITKFRNNPIGGIVTEGLMSMGNTTLRTIVANNPAIKPFSPLIPESIDTPIGEIEPKYSADPKKGAGQLFEDAANVIGGEGAVATAGQALKGALFKGAKEGLKTGLVTGGAMGVGEALQNDKSSSEIVRDTIIGTAAGGIFGSTVGSLGALAGAVKKFVSPNLAQAKEAYREALNFGKAELKRFDSPEKVNEVVDLFLEEGVPILTQDKGTKFSTKGEPVAILKNSMESVENTLDDVLEEFRGSKQIDFERIRTLAKRKIKEAGDVSADTINRRISFINNLVDQEIERFGRVIDPPTANKAKRGFWNLGYDMSAAERTTAARYLGNALKESIETTVGGDEIVKSLNKRLGLLQEGAEILGNLDGKAVRGGRLVSMFGRITGAVVGGNLGPVGALAGSEMAGKFSQFIVDPERITDTALTSMKKAGVLPKTVQTIQEAKNFIQKVRAQRASTLALPEPAIRLPEKSPSPSGIIKDAPVPQVQPVNKPKYTSPTTEAIDEALKSPTIKAIERATKSKKHALIRELSLKQH